MLDNAPQILADLLKDGFKPQSLDQIHDTLKLIGVVLGQMALLQIATDPRQEAAPRVSAARALMKTDESPETIAERLRRSPFASLTVEQLGVMVEKVRKGETDVQGLIEQLKQ